MQNIFVSKQNVKLNSLIVDVHKNWMSVILNTNSFAILFYVLHFQTNVHLQERTVSVTSVSKTNVLNIPNVITWRTASVVLMAVVDDALLLKHFQAG